MKYLLLSCLVLFSFSLNADTFSFKDSKETSIIMCENGLEMYQWDLDFIAEAQQSIEVLACFFGGDIAVDLLTRLESRLEEVKELQVYILTSPVLIRDKEWKMIERLKHTYPENFHIEFSTQIVKFLPDMTSIDNHVKLFVVDEKYFSAGGTNLEDAHCSDGTFTPKRGKSRNHNIAEHLPAGMRDQDLVGRGNLAKKLRKAFYKLYSLWEHYNLTFVLEQDPKTFKYTSHYFPVTEQAFVKRFDEAEWAITLPRDAIKVFLSGPHQQENEITQEYVRLINEAKEEIIIENLYFFPVTPIFEALMAAVKRGVALTVITNGLSDITPEGTKLFCWANRMSYVPVFYGDEFHLWEADKVRKQTPYSTCIYEYHVKDVLLHKKIMVVDKQTLLVGSYNLGFKSAYGDYELVIGIKSKKLVDAILEIHLKDLQLSREITPDEACGWYFDPFTAYVGGWQRKYNGFL